MLECFLRVFTGLSRGYTIENPFLQMDYLVHQKLLAGLPFFCMKSFSQYLTEIRKKNAETSILESIILFYTCLATSQLFSTCSANRYENSMRALSN